MKILISICFFIFFTSFLHSQSGEVIYGIKFNSQNDSLNKLVDNPSIKNEIDQIASQLKFKLIFNQSNSQFDLVKNLFLEQRGFHAKVATRIYGTKGRYSSDIQEKYLVHEKSFLNKPFKIKTNLDNIKWTLTKESKDISGYKCFKAVTKKYSTDRNFNKIEHNVSVWYTPEIPINFGPFEAVGLPGLVLQYDLVGRSIVVEKIDFNKEIVFEKVDFAKTISKEDFDNLIKKRVIEEEKNND